MIRTLTLPSQSSIPVHPSRRPRIISAAVSTSVSVDRKNLYEVLRVKRTASQMEIKTAYRTLAKLYHPDATSRFMDSSSSSIVSSTDGRDFIEIHDAYATLSDPDARAVYDCNLSVDSPRRWTESGFRTSGRGGFYPTRRWETDQCW